MESQRYFVKKNTTFVASGIGVLWPPENKQQILKPKHSMINRSLGQIPQLCIAMTLYTPRANF